MTSIISKVAEERFKMILFQPHLPYIKKNI